MESLPVNLKLKGLPFLVVGGGDVALRKVDLLARAGAYITVVAPEVEPALQELLASCGGRFFLKCFSAIDLKGMRFVIAGTNSLTVNQSVYEAAERAGVLVNVVDQPELCRFIFPAIVDRSPLQISISSNGQMPVLARWVRTQLETQFPKRFGNLAALLGEYREASKRCFNTIQERRLFWESVLEGDIAECVLKGQEDLARQKLRDLLENSESQKPKIGEVYLVGAGPGAADLMTFRALRLLQKADVVIFDRLVSDEIVDLARRDADKIYAGKKRDEHTIPQQEINQLLVELAKAGKVVCRLKGGDPFIFGRGGEEIQSLMQEGIPFQVVPAVTAAAGCAAYAGIPLTHRDYAQSVRFVTGHLKQGELALDWDKLVVKNETLVFYMGLVSLPIICRELVRYGMSPQRPVALVEQGTLPGQRVIKGTLASFHETVEKAAAQSPCLLIIGEVVNLQDSLAWFEV